MLEQFEPSTVITFIIVGVPTIGLIITSIVESFREDKETEKLIDTINYKRRWTRKMKDETLDCRVKKYR